MVMTISCLMLKGVDGLADPLPYNFKEDKEASSSGMSSGPRQLLVNVAQEGHTFLLSLTFGTQLTISRMYRLNFSTYL